MTVPAALQTDLIETVTHALTEDIGSGDVTAELIPADKLACARVIVREPAVICGGGWVNEVFAQVDAEVQLSWQVEDGDLVSAEQTLFEARGCARSLLTAERAALNFLQTLSGTATRSHRYASLVEGTGVRLLDTRKPGAAQCAEICRGLWRLS